MTTRPLWWFTKDVLRRTTEGPQLEEDYDVDEECRGRTEKHKERDQNQSRRRKSGRGGEQGGAYAEGLYPKARAHVHTFHFFFMCPVASEGNISLVAISLEGT